MKVGFIGLGIMGKPMSMNLLKAGNELVVFDFNETAVAEVVAAGAKGVKSGAEVAAECDTIITMVPNSPHVRAACLGEGGIAETAKPGTVVIDMSSIDPVESKKIGAELAEKGIELMDAPVSGGAEGKRQLERIVKESRENTGGRCKGVFYWEPECKPSQYRLGAFTADGRPTMIMDAFK